jgi:WD40 repeat protein/DNA-binding SARP family transcriptional activator
MPHLTLELLGSARITAGELHIDLRVRKELALLAFLAVEQQRHRRETLLGLLWPDMLEETARNNLRVVLAGLRRALGAAADDVLIADRQYVQFARAGAPALDVSVFRRLLGEVRTHAHAAVEHCEVCTGRLAEAAELYRGDFLQGFSLPDSIPFEEWASVQREQLHQQQLDALDTLAIAHERRGDYAGQAGYARRQLVLEPWREQAHAQLIRALWVVGQRSAALEQYETCRRILADELGIEPDEQTRALYEQIRSGAPANAVTAQARPLPPAAAEHWNDAPSVGPLFGRAAQATALDGWLAAGVRVLVVLGLGGVGKTALAATVARASSERFDAVVWRSLVNAPPPDETLRAILDALGGHTMTAPTGLDEQFDLLLRALRQRRCLLVLDNMESLLEDGQPGVYRVGYAAYGQLLQRLGEHEHRSSLLVTSRELPGGLQRLDATTRALRVLHLGGLDTTAGGEMLAAQGVPATAGNTSRLVARYSGNPLALKLVAQTIEELFLGDVGAFLAGETLFPDDIAAVLDQQQARLSALEWDLLLWLAIEREPLTAAELRANLVPTPPPQAVLGALQALRRRSLVEQSAAPGAQPGAAFLLQNVIMEYATARFVDEICREVAAGPVRHLQRHALLKAQAKEYVRQSQERLLLRPVAERLLAQLSIPALADRIHALLDALRDAAPPAPGYAGGNLLNLLLRLGIAPSGFDFSRLSVWQADLRGVTSAAINFSGADLSYSAFTSVFSLNRLRFTADGQLLVAGLSGDELRVWRAADGGLHNLFRHPGAGPRAIAFSHDGRLLATCGLDHSVHVWSIPGGERMHTFQGHTGPLLTLAFSNDGQRLASSSRDRTVRVWDISSGALIHTLHEHAAAISGLVFGTDGSILAGGGDRVICLWDTCSGRVIRTLLGHRREIECFAFTPDDRQLVSGAHDGSIRLWDVASGETLQTFQGHSQIVRAVALHPDGHTLASGGADRLVRLWDLRDGQVVQTWFDHDYEIVSLAFSTDGQVLASGSVYPTVKLWDTRSGNALDTITGHGEIVRSVQFSPNGRIVASTGATGLVRLWDISGPEADAPARNRLVRSLAGHAREIRAVAFSPDGRLLASGGADRIVQVWDMASGTLWHTFHGHTNTVKALAFRPDGRVLASGGSDRTIRLWPIDAIAAPREEMGWVLRGHTDEISSLAFSHDGRTLLSSSLDHTARIWAIGLGLTFADDGEQETQVLTAPGCTLSGAVFSPDGQLAVATGYNGTVHIWDVGSGERRELWSGGDVSALQIAFSADGAIFACVRSDRAIEIRRTSDGEMLQRLSNHRGEIETIAFSPRQPLLASSGWDGLIRIWDVESGACLWVLRVPGPYAGMNITGVKGISHTQKAVLAVLGAVEGDAPEDYEVTIEN